MVKTILICDDDKGILEVSSAVLESSGYKVLAFSSFDNFFNILKQEKPDLLLIDLWMPKIGGEKIIKRLKVDKKTKHIPVIIISASRELSQISKTTGANGFLGKPFDIDDLLSIVKKTIS